MSRLMLQRCLVLFFWERRQIEIGKTGSGTDFELLLRRDTAV